MKNECYTYFNVFGDFDPDEISAVLGLKPFRVIAKGSRRDEKTVFDFSSCDFCICDEYDFDINVMIAETVRPLRDKTEKLRRFRETHDVEYSIKAVPQIYLNQSTPAFGLDLDTIDFCHAVRAYVDIDLYVNADDE